uniref:Uncharacterized protein n=1 Tax=Arundo donax TaxID=35708 RepID=A0A0A9BYC8_ARUDO
MRRGPAVSAAAARARGGRRRGRRRAGWSHRRQRRWAAEATR